MKINKYIKYRKVKYFFIFLLILFLFITRKNKVILYDESSYFTSWATGIHKTVIPKFKLENNSIRQIIRVSSGGEKIRIKFSNLIGNTKLEIKKVSIADLVSNSEINKHSLKYLTFNGKNSVIIEKNKEVYSDTLFYPLKTFSEIAISIYLGSVPKKLSGHGYSYTYSYIEEGNKINKKIFSDKNKVGSMYFISALEISSEHPNKVVVCFGDSITDGVILKNNVRDNYPDMLFQKLSNYKMTSNISVVNVGINGDRLMEKGIKRYKNDVLDIKGISYIISLYGVNDINALEAKADQIISYYKEIIRKAHEKNILIYTGTILPFGRYMAKHFWNKKKEKERLKVNKWIRETDPKKGGFDSYIDFDKYLKSPKNNSILKNIYDSGDGIHPSVVGYKKMVEIININLFSKK